MAYELISSYTNNGNNQFTFSNIPNTYKHLRVIFSHVYGTQNVTVDVQPNGDTSADWYRFEKYWYQNGVTNALSSFNTTMKINSIWSAISSSTTSGCGYIDFLDYTNTSTDITAYVVSGNLGATGYSTGQNLTRWQPVSTNSHLGAVSSLKFITGNSTAFYGTFELYGWA